MLGNAAHHAQGRSFGKLAFNFLLMTYVTRFYRLQD